MAPERKLVHVERITVRWADMDALGHVNNAVYFRYMEQARISFVERLCSLLAVIAKLQATTDISSGRRDFLVCWGTWEFEPRNIL
jgi:acyl-CoA thioesterase FadM